MRDLDDLFRALSFSSFRSKFCLAGEDLEYLRDKGLATVLQHAHDFVQQRLASADPKNDGHQTPFSGHPVFVAQHATATCCRACLEKWHRIPRGAELTAEQRQYVLKVIERWLREQGGASIA
jgi:hypothetical protein